MHEVANPLKERKSGMRVGLCAPRALRGATVQRCQHKHHQRFKNGAYRTLSAVRIADISVFARKTARRKRKSSFTLQCAFGRKQQVILDVRFDIEGGVMDSRAFCNSVGWGLTWGHRDARHWKLRGHFDAQGGGIPGGLQEDLVGFYSKKHSAQCTRPRRAPCAGGRHLYFTGRTHHL